MIGKISETIPCDDLRSILEAGPGTDIILRPDLTIVEVSESYLTATMTRREEIIGRKLFEIFPDDPDETDASAVANLRDSIDRVIETHATDVMPIHKYPIRRRPESGGEFEERYWSSKNVPVFRDGELIYIIHHVEDVTEFVKLCRERSEEHEAAEKFQSRAEQMEAKVYEHSSQVANTQTELRKAYDKLQEELELERNIVRAMKRPLRFEVPEDAFSGLSVATIYSTVPDEESVGGDFYDVIPLSNERVALAVGDISGHGIEAAARATEVKDVLRAFLRAYPSCANVAMAHLNDYLVDIQNVDKRNIDVFVALSLVIVNATRSELSISWAGINPPFIIGADGIMNNIHDGNPPLSIVEHGVFSEHIIAFNPGDTLVLTTDGITEARRGKEMLGTEGAEELIKRALSEPTLHEVGETILTGARDYAGGELKDDACIVLARRK